jgi:hypothetical protein
LITPLAWITLTIADTNPQIYTSTNLNFDNMRFNVLTVALFLGSTLAFPLNHEKRDLRIIESSVKQVDAALSKLDNALRGAKPTSDPKDQQSYIRWLLDLDNQVQSAMTFGSGEVRRAPNINELEAARLAFVMDPVLRETRSTMNGWTNIKRIVQSAGMVAVVRDQLSKGAIQSSGFADAIISRLPVINRGIGQTFKSSIMSPIDSTIRGYAR